jgi:hypothetical protein
MKQNSNHQGRSTDPRWPNGVDPRDLPAESGRFLAEHEGEPVSAAEKEKVACARCGIICDGPFCMRCATIRLVQRLAGQEVE